MDAAALLPGKEAEAWELALVLALAAWNAPALVTLTETVPPWPALLAAPRAHALPVVAEARLDELALQVERAEPRPQRETAGARSAQALGCVARSFQIQLRRLTACCRPSHY